MEVVEADMSACNALLARKRVHFDCSNHEFSTYPRRRPTLLDGGRGLLVVGNVGNDDNSKQHHHRHQPLNPEPYTLNP